MLTAKPPAVDKHIRFADDDIVHEMGIMEWDTTCGKSRIFYQVTDDPVTCEDCLSGTKSSDPDPYDLSDDTWED